MAKVKADRQSVGRWGENLAAEYLAGQGYSIIGRNGRTPYGEIDIIAQRDDVIYFVEVKTRTSSAFGLPETSITARKQSHMIQAAEAYLQEHPELYGTWQIDIIAVQSVPDKSRVEIVHFENAVS